MKFKLPNNIASPQDLNTLLIEFQQYTKWFEHELIKKQTNAKHPSESPILSPAANELLHTYTANKPLDRLSLESIIDTLKKYKKDSPSITLTLAAPPTGTVKNTLVTWCRENIAPDILVSFQFNTTLLGGVVVRYGSHIFDWSFRRQILAARKRFPEVLRHV